MATSPCMPSGLSTLSSSFHRSVTMYSVSAGTLLRHCTQTPVNHASSHIYTLLYKQAYQPLYSNAETWIHSFIIPTLSLTLTKTYTQQHTHTFNDLLSVTTQVGWYQKCKTDLDFTEARDSEQQWHQLGHMQVCISLQADNHTSTTPLSFLQAGCPSCRPTNSVKALKETLNPNKKWNKNRYLKKHTPCF